MNAKLSKLLPLGLLLAMFLLLQACSSSDSGSADGSTSTGAFTIAVNGPVNLTEGDSVGVNIPVTLNRIDGHSANIIVSLDGFREEDNRLITTSVTPAVVNSFRNSATVNMRLDIDDLPILPEQRAFTITASDGTDTATTSIAVNVQPVNAPDVYLLAGQSNMVGFSGDGTKLSEVGGPDEPHPRILQLNVSKNDQFEVFTTAADFISEDRNVINAQRIVRAEDPLHVPLDPTNQSSKDLSYIGLGISFAKTALNSTTQNIILVPAAWSGSAFCDNFDGPIGQWNAQATDDNPNLGNTWLFERAVTRTNIALAESDGILRGILWHQGESDANDRCAGKYLANLERMAQQFRLRIDQDVRGGNLRRSDANIPFVLGTMSRGIDDRGDLSDFYTEKQQIDDAHRTLPSKITHAEIAYSDDLIPSNGFPCGNTNCIHFGAAALREMGRRYHEALVRAAEQP